MAIVKVVEQHCCKNASTALDDSRTECGSSSEAVQAGSASQSEYSTQPIREHRKPTRILASAEQQDVILLHLFSQTNGAIVQPDVHLGFQNE